MEENNFTTVDVGKTFINSSGSDCSSIDYSIFPVSFKDQLTDIAKIDNLHSLVSDHYPVRATISIDFSKNHPKSREKKLSVKLTGTESIKMCINKKLKNN
jgi:UPF0288 family protein (methanogenesis marker protein 3)